VERREQCRTRRGRRGEAWRESSTRKLEEGVRPHRQKDVPALLLLRQCRNSQSHPGAALPSYLIDRWNYETVSHGCGAECSLLSIPFLSFRLSFHQPSPFSPLFCQLCLFSLHRSGIYKPSLVIRDHLLSSANLTIPITVYLLQTEHRRVRQL